MEKELEPSASPRDASRPDDGGPAFARPQSSDPDSWMNQEFYHAQEGMSLRDYFAAKAMAGLLASGFDAGWDRLARSAFDAADAMLEARRSK